MSRGLVAVALMAGLGFTTPARLRAQEASTPEILPRSCEIELALSAAPPHLRDEAAVWVMDEGGYSRARQGSNGFACIVNRDDPRSLKPTCFDPEGAVTMIPRIEFVGRLLLEGASPDAIRERVAAAFASGTLIRPRRAGVAYMLSPQNRPWNPQAGRLGHFPPHVMVYAPDVTNDEIGIDSDVLRRTPGLPFVGYQGPHGFIIVVSDDLPPGEGDLSTCPAWLAEDGS